MLNQKSSSTSQHGILADVGAASVSNFQQLLMRNVRTFRKAIPENGNVPGV
jgi:hypothetical protein